MAAAQLARNRGDLENTVAHLERARAIAPDRTDALSQLAHLRWELQDEAAAFRLLAEAHEASPDDFSVLSLLCSYLAGRDDARVIALVDAHLARHPENVWAWRERPLAYLRRGDLDGAIAAGREMMAHLPHDSFAYSVLAKVLIERGELDEARRALRRAVELDVDNASAIALFPRSTPVPDQLRYDARFVLERLEARISRGEGLIEAAYLAGALPRDERKARLERLLERSPHRPTRGKPSSARAWTRASSMKPTRRRVPRCVAFRAGSGCACCAPKCCASKDSRTRRSRSCAS